MGLLETLNLTAPTAPAAGASAPRPARAASGNAVAAQAPRAASAAGPAVGPAPVDTTIEPMAAAEMPVEDIAAAIMDLQAAVLVGWKTALDTFDKRMESAADAETTPDFQKAVIGHFTDKLMGTLIKQAPGAEDVMGVVNTLSGEYNRAATAAASARLRDFIIQHAKAVGSLHQAVLSQRQGFISAVKARRVAYEQAIAAAAKPKKGAKPAVSPAAVQLGALRIVLKDIHDGVARVRGVSDPDTLFRVLSERWMKNSTVYAGMGLRVPGVVVIRLNPNYAIKDAHIQGSGGQKIAEQLLLDTPGGVDVFALKARRRILLLAANGWPSATLNLDENNKDLSTGAYLEGDTTSLYRYVTSHNLGTTTKLTGD